ncbi:MAG TPA: response regulator [Ktedonobacterales bacterium]
MTTADQAPVLAVDDSGSIREMIATVLAGHGYRVVTAANGKEALMRLHAAAEPYIVLLDVVMPLLDGLAVLREINSDAHLSAMPHQIILMSSTVRMSQPDIPATTGQLAKPFTRQRLLEVVAQAQQDAHARH